MKSKLIILLLIMSGVVMAQDHSEAIQKIYQEQLNNSHAYENLRYLTKEIGNRLSGSPRAAAAVEYTRQLMEGYGFDTVFLQPVMVPHWVRGKKEIARIINSDKLGTYALNPIALGNSVGTGPGGVVAEVVEVTSMQQVENLGEALKGKIVFFNLKADLNLVNSFRAYGGTVIQRVWGASEAAKYGARAVIVRSATNFQDDIPHTGTLRYKPNIAQIPAAAISTNEADMLSGLLQGQDDLKIYLETNCGMQGEKLSYNVVGQLNGSEFPDEYIAVGGHLDSWDVGEGAHDDGAGCVQGIEVLRTFKALGIQPKRTLRAVMWMNEENGGAGGRGYANYVEEHGEKHIAAMESDRGGFVPRGFTSTGTDKQQKQLQKWGKAYFTPYELHSFDQPGGGADIGPLAPQGTFLIGLLPDSQRYFKYHHTAEDVFENVNQRELVLGAAAMTAMIYLVDQEGI